MQAQCILNHMNLAVKGHLAYRVGVAHELVFKFGHIVVKRAVRPNAMRLRVFFEQPLRQTILRDECVDLTLQRFWIAPQQGQSSRRHL